MAIGITRQIASGTHQQVQIPSGNYPWPTIRILNPNDGVVYVKQNADVTNTGYGSWDYKVPSQSFGLLPGEGQGWQSVGLYYLDQSGSGANGEVSIYLTQQNATEPVFQSIGRAIVSQTTSMDVVQGSQPANPGAGISRIWSDPSGSLNILMPNGTNKVVLDSTNYGGYSVGGDAYGTINNIGILLQNIHYIQALGTAGAQARVLGRANTNSTYLFTGTDGLLQFYSDFPGALLGTWNANNLLLTINNALVISNSLAVPTIYLNTSGGSGPYIQNSSGASGGAASIRYAASTGYVHSFELTGGGYGPVNTGVLTVTGNAGVNGLLTVTNNVDAFYFHTTDGSNGAIFADTGALYLRAANGTIVIDGGGGGNGDLSVAHNAVIGGTFRAGSNTGFMGQYAAGTAFSSTTLNTWLPTPVAVSFTVNVGASGSIFVTCNVMVSSAVVGTAFYIAIAIDSAITTYRAFHISVANYYQLATTTEAFTGLGGGAHTATLYVQANAGVFSIWNAAHDVLNVQGLMS